MAHNNEPNKKPLEKKSEKILTARAEEWLNKEVLPEETRQVVLFALGDEWYGVDMQNVRIVIAKPQITPVPFVPGYIAGIVNLRGTILSVMNLRALFEFEEKIAGVCGDYVVVVETPGLASGLLVDHIVEAVEIPVSKFQPVAAGFDPVKHKWIESQVHMDDKIIAMIQVDRFMHETKLSEHKI